MQVSPVIHTAMCYNSCLCEGNDGVPFLLMALPLSSLGAFIVRISASLLTFTLKQETAYDTHLFHHVMISQSLCISQHLPCNNSNNNKKKDNNNSFPFTEDDWKLDSKTAKSVQYHWAQNLFCKIYATSYIELEKKNPCNIQTQLTELAVKNFIHCIYKCISTIFKRFLSCSCVS